ncbi:MAG: argininosuccinate lyase [Candidatus Dormibacteraceae bacterium]
MNQSTNDGKLWGGRFQRRLLPELERFNSSLEFDLPLYPYDIAGSVAHARGLAAAKLLSAEQLTEIEQGLRQIREELDEGKFEFRESDEDIHTAVERRLTELAPVAGGSLHAGRSRNDQLVLDVRLYCRAMAASLTGLVAQLIQTLAEQARAHADWPMPGYTHLQRAQPVTVGHHLLAYAEALLRDGQRLQYAYQAADELPLGSAALAGSTLPLRREVVAAELGFARLSQNSMDAVANRDFHFDLTYACAVIGIHLSRWGEDVVLWSSSEFGFVELADEISTGSSIMPQKKNPDIAELIRGRSGRAVGSLMALLTVHKGLPMAYDRDLQEERWALLPTVGNAEECLKAARLVMANLKFNRSAMTTALEDPGLYATDTAEQLVGQGMTFRDAHRQVGETVAAGFHQPPWGAEESLAKRDLVGAPQPARVRARVEEVIVLARELKDWAEAHPPSLPS